MEDRDWLPELVLLKDCDGDWEVYFNLLYRHFCNDFIHSKPQFEGKRWAMKRHPLFQGKEATFWHIISEGENELERLPDLRRCERILWPRLIIDMAKSSFLKVWRNKRGNDERILLALEDFSYVVILSDRGDFVLLWTAYYVETTHQRKKLEKEYLAYKKGLASS